MIRQQIVFYAILLFTALIGFLDYQTGEHISMMLMYSLSVLAASWYCGRLEGIVIAATATACWFIVSLILNPQIQNEGIVSWNAFSRLGILCLIAYSVSLQANLRRALAREQLRADTDRLTGLLNKAAFREHLEEEINRSRRYNHPLSLAFIDLDNFKLMYLAKKQGKNNAVFLTI